MTVSVHQFQIGETVSSWPVISSEIPFYYLQVKLPFVDSRCNKRDTLHIRYSGGNHWFRCV